MNALCAIFGVVLGMSRGSHCASGSVFDPAVGNVEEGHQDFGAEQLHQDCGCVHRRNQVRLIAPYTEDVDAIKYISSIIAPPNSSMPGSPMSSSVRPNPAVHARSYSIRLTTRTGHSERRSIFGETSALVATKTRVALDAGLSVILCVGETLEEREGGKTQQVVEEQLKAVIDVTKAQDWRCAPTPSIQHPTCSWH